MTRRDDMRISVILPAAGLGQRFAAGGRAAASKIEHLLDGKPVFLHAVEAFRAVPGVEQIILAVHPDQLDDFRFRWNDALHFQEVTLVAGGRAERWETVKLALRSVFEGATHIAVHDAARPLVSSMLIERVLAAAESWPAVIPGIPVSNTLKRIDPPPVVAAPVDPIEALLNLETESCGGEAQRIVETVSREHLIAVQTPQVFAADLLRRAYDRVDDPSRVTDDAGLIEALGETVVAIDGDATNLKITRPEDAELAAAVLANRRAEASRDTLADLFDDDDE
jgi:2-C-methyl-D-erythritol 4-phosphate cytidylyltransferase